MPNTILKEKEVSMLREEMEILMNERQSLLDTTGAAAFFVANLDSTLLPNVRQRRYCLMLSIIYLKKPYGMH